MEVGAVNEQLVVDAVRVWFARDDDEPEIGKPTDKCAPGDVVVSGDSIEGRWPVIQSMKMANRYALVLAELGLVKVCPQCVQRHRCFPLEVVPIFVLEC